MIELDYFRHISQSARKDFADAVSSWATNGGTAPQGLKAGLLAMIADGVTREQAERRMREQGFLSNTDAIPAQYWYSLRQSADENNLLPASTIARRLLLDESSVGAFQRSRRLGRAFDAIAESVEMGDYDRVATLIRLADAMRVDEAALRAMDTGEDIATAMASGGVMPDRVQTTLNISAIDELTNLIRAMESDAAQNDGT